MAKFILALILVGLFGCTNSAKNELKMAREFSEKKKFDQAAELYHRVIQRNSDSTLTIQAIREIIQIEQFQRKDYLKAIDNYRLLILNSKDPEERVQAQKSIATIFFSNLQDYRNSIIEYGKLLAFQSTDYEKGQVYLSLARANFYLNNFFQAESEINEVLAMKSTEEQRFEALLIKSNIFLSKKDYKSAIEILKMLLKEFNERSIEANVPITLAVCLEELNDFAGAIVILNKYLEVYTNKKDFMDLRIKKLKERQKNQPGAHGLRK